MPHGDVETFHQDGQWHNRVEGESGLLGSYPSKEEAVAQGRQQAIHRKVEHIIKNLATARSQNETSTDTIRETSRAD